MPRLIIVGENANDYWGSALREFGPTLVLRFSGLAALTLDARDVVLFYDEQWLTEVGARAVIEDLVGRGVVLLHMSGDGRHDCPNAVPWRKPVTLPELRKSVAALVN